MKRFVIIIFLALIFNVTPPLTAQLNSRTRHSIEYVKIANSKVNETDLLRKKIYIYCRLIEVEMKIMAINTNNSFINTS